MSKRYWFFLLPLVLSLTACGQIGHDQAYAHAAEAPEAWAGDWHGVWSIEFDSAPVDGPLVAEIWHAADGRLRIETLDAPTTALKGLTLVDTGGGGVWFYDLRQNRAELGPADLERIPIASDSLLVMDWMLDQVSTAAIKSAHWDSLESGRAARLSLVTEAGDEAEFWVHNKTGLPAGLELQSRRWGKVVLTSRSLEAPRSLTPGLFDFEPPADASILIR